MNKLIVVALLVMVFLAGCAWLEQIAPPQYDEEGNPIAGTHQLNETGQAIVSNLGVTGGLATAIPLLIWNFVELFKAKKDQKGLVATIKALKSASDDPKVKQAWETIKNYLEQAHDVAGVKDRIKDLLARVV